MNRKMLLIVLLLSFVAYAGFTLSDTVTPYVDIASARQATGNVQVKGILDKKAPPPHMDGTDFVFSLADEETGDSFLVRYHGQEPDRFVEAYHIVAVGKYTDGVFSADKLLIKCPSKYERERNKNG